MASAMLELKRVLGESFLALRKHNGVWGVWHTGEDWEMNEAEKAALIARKPRYDYSEELFRPVVDPDGAIRAFTTVSDEGIVRCGDTPMDGLRKIVDAMLYTTSYADDFDLRMTPKGSMTEVDVVLLELATTEYQCDDRIPRVIGHFVYDTVRGVLLHREVPKPVRRRHPAGRTSRPQPPNA